MWLEMLTLEKKSVLTYVEMPWVEMWAVQVLVVGGIVEEKAEAGRLPGPQRPAL